MSLSKKRTDAIYKAIDDEITKLRIKHNARKVTDPDEELYKLELAIFNRMEEILK